VKQDQAQKRKANRFTAFHNRAQAFADERFEKQEDNRA